MRFKKGDKVEVMNKEEAPVSWRVAEILSGDGRIYHVKYDTFRGMAGEQIVERISRKFVRPCPPLVEDMETCIAGDIVEVFYENSWKVAAILQVLGSKKKNRRSKIHLLHAAAIQNQYLVRLLGSSQELVTDMLNIRMRHTWHDGEWILMEKNSRGENVPAGKPSTSNCYQKMNFQVSQFNARAKKPAKQDCLKIQDGAEFWDPAVISSRSLKRMSPYSSSIVETHDGHIQKLRAIEKDGRKQKVIATTPVLEKVDAAAYPRKLLGEQNMHFSNIISNGYNQMERGKVSEYYGCSGVRSSEISSSHSDACSVGSCSVTSHSPNNIPFIPLPFQEMDTLGSDAESCCGSGSARKCSSFFPKEKVEVSVRRLELHAYRSTLEALYAAGPLSWDQEALLTNLRIMLRISNDEHLIELKQLISAKTAMNVGYL